MIPTYGSFRKQLGSDTFSVSKISGSTSEAIALTYYVYIQLHNRVGLNQLSPSKQITIASGEGIAIAINDNAINLGEDVFWIVVSISPTDNPLDAVRICAIAAREDDQVTFKNLPVTVNLTTDEHFKRSRTVPTFDELPTTGMLDGAIAYVEDTSSYFYYDKLAYADAELGYLSYGTIVSGANKWIKFNSTPSTYVDDTRGAKGCDRPLITVENALTIPPKVGDEDSSPITYWLNNGFESDGQSPIINGRYSFAIGVDGVTGYEAVFAQKIKYVLLGYFDRDSNNLDTDIATVGDLKVWTPTDPIELSQELPRNFAAVYRVFLSYQTIELIGKLPTNKPNIRLDILVQGNNTGQLSEIANTIGDLVQGDGGKLLIVPGEKRLSGNATIEMPGAVGFKIASKIEQPIIGLEPNLDNQIAAIAGSLNGLITIRSDLSELQYSEKVRAYIGTKSGLSNLKLISEQISVVNRSIKVTISHPVLADGKGVVRSDYPDLLLAGNSAGQFTPRYGYLFFYYNATLYQSDLLDLVAIQAQTFNFATPSALNEIFELPQSEAEDFSLFEPEAIVVEENGSGEFNGVIKAYFAYYYDSQNLKATRIRHDIDGCIPTTSLRLSEVIANMSAAIEHIRRKDNPHEITVAQIGAASQDEVTTLTPFARLKTKEILELPYLLTPEDHGMELTIFNMIGEIQIPDNLAAFEDGYQVLIALDEPGEVTIVRENGSTNNLLFTNDKKVMKSLGEVIIRRRESTDVVKVTGFLE